MRISELGRGALVRLKKSQALAKIDVFFPEKKEKKIVLKRRRPRTFYILHLPPSCIFQNYFAIKMYILCTRKNISTQIRYIHSSLKKSLKSKKNVCYFIRNFSCNLIIILLTMLFKFNTDTPKRSPVQPPISAKRDKMV